MPSESWLDPARWSWLWRPLRGSLALAMLPLLAVAGIALLLRQSGVAGLDRSASLWLQGPAEPALTAVGFVTDWLCSWQFLLSLAALGCLALALTGRWLAAFSGALIFPLVAVEVAMKYAIEEPPASHFLQTRSLFTSSYVHIEGLSNGFPSGHAARIGFAAGWLAVFCTPARYRAVVLGAVELVTLFVGWTRIYVGDHSALEIVAGLLLSLAFLFPAWRLLELSRQPAR